MNQYLPFFLLINFERFLKGKRHKNIMLIMNIIIINYDFTHVAIIIRIHISLLVVELILCYGSNRG